MTADPHAAPLVPADHHILALACGIVVVADDESPGPGSAAGSAGADG
jgi:hypothetical protein